LSEFFIGISSLGVVGGKAPLLIHIEAKATSLSGASAGTAVRPVGVKLRAKGYNAQQENAQTLKSMQLKQFLRQPNPDPHFLYQQDWTACFGGALAAALPC